MAKTDKQMVGINLAEKHLERLQSYRFWRKCGLAPWCSARLALSYRFGITR